MDVLSSNEILSELETLFIPNESIDSISKKFQLELMNRLQSSSNSMLPCDHIPNISLQELTSLTNTNFKNLTIDFGGTSLKFAILSGDNNQFNIEYEKKLDIKNKFVDFKFFENLIEWIILECVKFDIPKETHYLVSTTFSFPLDSQKRIITMGKGFKLLKELKNYSIVDILQISFDNILKKNLNSNNYTFEIGNVINDSVAVYLSNRFLIDTKHATSSSSSSSNNNISLILGTGTNSSFDVPLSSLPSFKKKFLNLDTLDENNYSMLINSELGFLGVEVINLTSFDHFNTSSIGYDMPLEYVTSGKYLSMILPKILLHYNLLPKSNNTIEEFINNFDGEVFSNILSENYEDLLTFFNLKNEKLDLITNICKILIKRASIYLVSSILAINDFLNKIYNRDIGALNSALSETESDNSDIESINSDNKTTFSNDIKVGYVGSFLAFSKYYHEQIKFYSNEQVTLNFLDNSSLIGAAVSSYISKIQK
ncbi:hypothetical protein TBLA_0B06320 [Henningerozyma blattae CBS 6284]|uniref:Phosphotransferase n=1 Tax=Henningerozyma blattae (strain ATCC 34711 / CBS 6284 / DSM 70876 / NBRC 10599 / NRRL Y-10934 / UCD 77-7) TaxID=1071380 RepID=I2GZA4_HENB6|nr:hypothetical protein TBLA_0B06320 [Tetrapisispora blattae CBS 6284]CCH59456.1 hypothetical protein TBLA_0B06320 [Tetrapisispora blattae CBS 6284]